MCIFTELFWVLAVGNHLKTIWDPFISVEADYSAIDGTWADILMMVLNAVGVGFGWLMDK